MHLSSPLNAGLKHATNARQELRYYRLFSKDPIFPITVFNICSRGSCKNTPFQLATIAHQ